jgi:hypothetical protein
MNLKKEEKRIGSLAETSEIARCPQISYLAAAQNGTLQILVR